MLQTTVRTERSEVVDGEPGRLWELVSSPAVWSLWPGAPFMFAVPGADALRCVIGNTGSAARGGLVEVTEEIPSVRISLRTLPAPIQEFTISVSARRRGASKLSVLVKEVVPRQNEIARQINRRDRLKLMLAAVRAVIEGRAPWPGVVIPADLLEACLARPHIEDEQSTSAAVVIRADPAKVWDVLRSPETARLLTPPLASHGGYVPGTPQGERGEMRYFVRRRSDGRLMGDVSVADEISRPLSALTHVLRPVRIEQRCVLTPESASGPTRLDLTLRWPALKPAEAAEAARNRLGQAAQMQLDGYKSLIEAAGKQA